MRAVNLLPKEATNQRKGLLQQDTPVLLGAGLGVVITGALALGFMHESSAISSAQSKLEATKVQLAKTPRPPQVPAKVDPNIQLQGEEAARLTAVTTALGGRMAWDRILREFSLVLPSDVWLTNLQLTTPDPTAAAAGTTATGLTITGTTYSHPSVARLLARLALVPELNNVTLQSDTSSSGAAGATGPNLITFTITAGVQVPAGAAALAAPAPAPPPPPTDTSTDSTGATS
jgi:Tfp pilus assembly protein PilN